MPEVSPDDTYDIVIIGGSNAGLALACALLTKPSIRATSKILLLEGGSMNKTRIWNGEGPWENRVSSITAENKSWLESIGAWQHIKHSRICPVEEMIVWANPSPSSTPTLHFPPLGHPMAYMTENQNLQTALLHRILSLDPDSSTLKIQESSKVTSMSLSSSGQSVFLQLTPSKSTTVPSSSSSSAVAHNTSSEINPNNERTIRAGLVIGADGPNSPVRKFSNIETYGHPYSTHAIVCTLHHPSSPYLNTTAFQRFLPSGPIAFLPLSATSSTLVWYNPPSITSSLKSLSSETFTTMINFAFSLPETTLNRIYQLLSSSPPSTANLTEQINEILNSVPLDTQTDQTLPPRIESISQESIGSFPIKMSHADSYLGQRTVLVGDAAHTIHPLAGQGLNMGLADVRSLSNTLEIARSLGGDIGSWTNLKDYPKERYGENHLLLSATDKLNWVFKSRGKVIDGIRGIGLELLNEIEPIKKLFMSGAGAYPIYTQTSESFIGGLKGRGMRGTGKGKMEMLADGLESWWKVKDNLGLVSGMMRDVASTGLKKAAEVVEKR
ncbi:ubiquinone biosynthesis monooxygenase COQ6 [Tremella mesenterica]|uniref:Ubiquinone biosynthesis monooxygenase COQ6, mitochondrial n=1 Tax=Tremella mesenterica TaxID=5217 RepID=A0A4Q1BRF4_TREME|nr:ubiquinone biosynthesis monooxygenase COQ6 [Tremella mesenterica]